MSSVGWLAMQKFVILVPDPIVFALWPVLLDQGELCDSCITRHTTTCRVGTFAVSSWSKVWDVEGITSLAVLPNGVCSRSECSR